MSPNLFATKLIPGNHIFPAFATVLIVQLQVFQAFLVLAKIPLAIEKDEARDRLEHETIV